MEDDYYRILDVASDATQAELRKAYLKLARAHHPDGFDAAGRRQAEQRMQAINEAWNVLGVPHRRKQYDAGRRDGGPRSTSGPRRGRDQFQPFDDEFQPFDDDSIERDDIDLDPTPLAGSRPLPRWVTLAPLALVVFGVVVFAFGLLVNAAAIIAVAFAVVAVGGVSFLMVPLLVMSRAERDPTLYE